jgi:hypothetical protein
MLSVRPRDHWLLTQAASACLRKKDYDGAILFAADALTIEFTCPLAQFIFANALAAQGQTKESIEFCEPLSRSAANNLVRSKCGEGSDCNINLERANILIAEAQSVVGLSYLENAGLARSSLFQEVGEQTDEGKCVQIIEEKNLSNDKDSAARRS